MDRISAEIKRRAIAEAEKERLLHQQFAIVVGTLGSIAFAGLVLVLEKPSAFIYKNNILLTSHQSFDLLILMLSMTSALALFSVVAAPIAGSGMVKGTGSIATFGLTTGILSIVGMLFSILEMISDFSTTAANIFSVFLVVMLVSLYIAVRRTGREERPLV